MPSKLGFLKKYCKKIIWSSAGLLLLFGLFYVYLRFPVITGYAAKNMCSCVFVADRDEKNIAENELQFSFIKYAKTAVDYEHKKVTATLLGLGSKTAYYHPSKGCALIDELDSKNFVSSNTTKPEFESSELQINLNDSSIDYKLLNQVITDHFEDADPERPFGARSMVVLYRGKIVAEKYADGFTKNTRQIGWSMTKSIFNALIGIAIKQNILDGINDQSLFETWKNDERNNITLKQLLQMNSGLKWEENYSNLSEVTCMLYDSDNMIDFVEGLPLEEKIGSEWKYSSGTSNLLSGLLRNRFENSEQYFQFPYRELFAKLGANSFIIETDAYNHFVASSYAWATARDWAKFGQLYANDGVVNGKRIFPEGWVRFSHDPAKGSSGKYGAQFWVATDEKYPDSPDDLFYADGFQGQRIFIIPSKEIVIVRLGLTKFDQPDYNALVKGVVKAIES